MLKKKDQWILIDRKLCDLGKMCIDKLIKEYYDCHEYMATMRFINKNNINDKRYNDILHIYIFLTMI